MKVRAWSRCVRWSASTCAPIDAGRWTQGEEVRSDGRPTALHPPSARPLSEAKCTEVLRVSNDNAY